MIGLYAIVRRAPQEAVGARAEPLLEIGFEGFCVLAGDAPPALSVDALRAHEAAVRRIAEACAACLPARFGAAAADEEALRRELAPRAAELLEALQLVEGREQMTLRVHGRGPAPASNAPPFGLRPGTRYLEDRRRARHLPELDPLRTALASLTRAERVERHSEPGLLASVYHLIDRGSAQAYGVVVCSRGGAAMKKDDVVAMQVRELESLRKEIERRVDRAPRWNADPKDVQKSVARLVLALIEFLRKLLEKQAIRRMEAGTLTSEQTEAIGLALMRLEETVHELARRFGLAPEDLNLDLGPLGRLI